MENKQNTRTADCRKDFPLLQSRREDGKRIVYLDNAATAQRPVSVIEAVKAFDETGCASPHRGAYQLSAQATIQYEEVRKKVAKLLNASSEEEIIFTHGATESLNFVAYSYGMEAVEEGDEILIAISEHHSNLLPWQRVARKKKAALRYLYTDESGRIPLEEVRSKLNSCTKIVAVAQISNVLGMVNPIREITEMAHQAGAVVVMDGAQSVPHIPVDIQELDVDFLAFSGHKLMSPGGIGVLYGRRELLEKMEPFMVGGGIVDEVKEQTAVFTEIPWRFEAGTQNMEGAIGLGAAIDYHNSIGFDRIQAIEEELTRYALEKMLSNPDVLIYGDKSGVRKGIIAFNVKGVHPHDVATILDADGIAIRAGHHCANPLMGHLGIPACCRMSLSFYNTREDIDVFAESLHNVRRWLGLESRRAV